jgi:hypothetical protein
MLNNASREWNPVKERIPLRNRETPESSCLAGKLADPKQSVMHGISYLRRPLEGLHRLAFHPSVRRCRGFVSPHNVDVNVQIFVPAYAELRKGSVASGPRSRSPKSHFEPWSFAMGARHHMHPGVPDFGMRYVQKPMRHLLAMRDARHEMNGIRARGIRPTFY